MPKQPEGCGSHLLAEVRRDQHEPLLVARVQDHLVQILDVEEVAELRLRIFVRRRTVQVLLIDRGYVLLRQVRAVGRVLERLPHDIPARVVELVLDDDEPTLLVESQEIEPLARVGETVELLLDHQQFFAQRLRRVGKPLLQVLPLAELQIGGNDALRAAPDGSWTELPETPDYLSQPRDTPLPALNRQIQCSASFVRPTRPASRHGGTTSQRLSAASASSPMNA